TTNVIKQSAAFGAIIQGNMSVQQFASKLRKIGKIARMTSEQIREQWLRGLSPMNQFTLRSSGMFFQTMDNQLKNLSELEAYTFSQGNTSQQIQQPIANYNQIPVISSQPVQQNPIQTPRTQC